MDKATQGNKKHNTHNKITDAKNFLFGQLERLDNPDLKDDELKLELARSKAMTDIVGKIIESENIQVKKTELICNYGLDQCNNAQMLLEG